jgi:hypothetical protein
VGTELLPWVFTSGWASGINAYAVVLVMGLLSRFGHVGAIPHVLARPDILAAAAVLFLLEMVADKIPYLDSAWDAIHTFVRPAVGATMGYLLAHDQTSLDVAFSAAAGGFSALASHLVKAGVRAGINTSPEPASNIAVSSAEDVSVAGLVTLATVHPWWSATIAAVLLLAGTVVVVLLLRRLRGLKQRYDAWGERMGVAVPGRPGRSRRARDPDDRHDTEDLRDTDDSYRGAIARDDETGQAPRLS